MRTKGRSCKWCYGKFCRGVGDQDVCYAAHAHSSRDAAAVQREIKSHACGGCGRYVCGIHAWVGGLCPACAERR